MKLEDRVCPNCGKTFEVNVDYCRAKTHCSLQCFNATKKKSIKKICVCGKEFETRPSEDAKFCSRKCYDGNRMKGIKRNVKPRIPYKVPYQRKNGSWWIRDDDGIKRYYRYVAEKKIGRKLVNGELVHHLDEDVNNNVPENLEVLSGLGEHNKYHNRRNK